MACKIRTVKCFLLVFGILINLSGCAVSYYNEESETLHVIGLSHVKMKVPKSNGGQSVYHQVNSYGLAGGTLREGGFFSLGYSQNTVLDITDDQILCFVWPSSSLLDVKVNESKPKLLNGVCNDIQKQKDN